ncbi:transcriptional regulator with XRE-family HTH domain [Variovorax boronicumulans]|uniref:helix-turn-helix domain-containing protein n=1 Tax=Variovorax boronicumulans TaxID=436515 RepID=UPI002785B7B2|nr:helix-turn-helix transcriptional regulator [Variovorax boronicumulans]MDQ0072713.1 transcriptional regulator with XRE-family HTH domain [Variovorax boronicumulans]
MSGSFSERLNELAANADRGWQADLARHCGVSRPAISNWLSGRNNGINSSYLFAIADYFRVHARWLATGDAPKWAKRPTRLSETVQLPVGEVLTKFDEVALRGAKLTQAEHAELHLWLIGWQSRLSRVIDAPTDFEQEDLVQGL